MTLKHTKSTSGRVHRLTYQGLTPGNLRVFPGVKPEPITVTLCYSTPPQFDDQVQGDLFRRFERDHPGIMPAVGMLPVHQDASLDSLDRFMSPPAEDVAATMFERIQGYPYPRRPDTVERLVYSVAFSTAQYLEKKGRR